MKRLVLGGYQGYQGVVPILFSVSGEFPVVPCTERDGKGRKEGEWASVSSEERPGVLQAYATVTGKRDEFYNGICVICDDISVPRSLFASVILSLSTP